MRPERSSVFILRTMTWISLNFGRNFSRIILHCIAFYFLLFAPSAGKASTAYLQRALGRAPSWRERYRHVFTFAATIHDRVYLLNERFDLFSIEVRGEAELRALIEQASRSDSARRAFWQLRNCARARRASSRVTRGGGDV